MSHVLWHAAHMAGGKGWAVRLVWYLFAGAFAVASVVAALHGIGWGVDPLAPFRDEKPKVSPCTDPRRIAAERMGEVQASFAAVQASVPTLPPPGGFTGGSGARVEAERGMRTAVIRYSVVVEQNPACFDTATRADATALARVWAPS
jgi:hypothetical protein